VVYSQREVEGVVNKKGLAILGKYFLINKTGFLKKGAFLN